MTLASLLLLAPLFLSLSVTVVAVLWRIVARRTALADSHRVMVIVLGDIGRSPRIQYQAQSFMDIGHDVDIIGYPGRLAVVAALNATTAACAICCRMTWSVARYPARSFLYDIHCPGTEPLYELVESPKVQFHYLTLPPQLPAGTRKLVFLARAPFKVLHQIYGLARIMLFTTKRPDHILIQVASHSWHQPSIDAGELLTRTAVVSRIHRLFLYSSWRNSLPFYVIRA